MMPSVSCDREYLVQMLILGLFFIVAFFSSATVVTRFHFWVAKAKMKLKIAIFAVIALGIFTASDLATDACRVPWKNYGMAFSVFTMSVCCVIIGAFLFGRTPVLSEKEEKKAERPDKLTIFFGCTLVLVPLAVAIGACRNGCGGIKSVVIWLISSLAVLIAFGLYGAIMSLGGKFDSRQTSILRESEKQGLFFWLLYWLARIRWPG